MLISRGKLIRVGIVPELCFAVQLHGLLYKWIIKVCIYSPGIGEV